MTERKIVWLEEKMADRVRDLFEPRYKRELSDEEVFEIAANLTDVMELFLKNSFKRTGEATRT